MITEYKTVDGTPIDMSGLLIPKVNKVVSLRSLRARTCYYDMADLAVIFNHEVIEDENKVWRWKSNRLMCLLLEHAPVYMPSSAESHALAIAPYIGRSQDHRASISMNGLYIDHLNGLYSIEERMKFSMQIGYSLCGFSELFDQHTPDEYGRKGHKGENVTQYIRRIHKGKVLKL